MTTQKSILYVEDEDLLSEALSDKLTRSGFTVHVAKNGVEGLTLAQSVQPACIVLDIIMPKMHGIEMLKRLRAETWGVNIPVIILSNLSAQADVEESKKYHVKEFIIKAQCPLDDLVKKITTLLSA